MNRDEALKLLKGGRDEIAEWNWRYRHLLRTMRGFPTGMMQLLEADLRGADLSGVYLRHIDLTFAHGCGVPDALIKYLPSLIGSMAPIQFYSCFISYSHKDEEFAARLYSRMVQEKVPVWYAPEDMPWGEKLHEQIDRAIRVHDKLLLVLSANSLASEWVKTEIRKARKAEMKDGKRKLFPIRLADFAAIQKWECFDADSGKDLGVEIRE